MCFFLLSIRYLVILSLCPPPCKGYRCFLLSYLCPGFQFLYFGRFYFYHNRYRCLTLSLTFCISNGQRFFTCLFHCCCRRYGIAGNIFSCSVGVKGRYGDILSDRLASLEDLVFLVYSPDGAETCILFIYTGIKSSCFCISSFRQRKCSIYDSKIISRITDAF